MVKKMVFDILLFLSMEQYVDSPITKELHQHDASDILGNSP